MYVHMAITMSKRRLKCNIYIETLQSVAEKVIGNWLVHIKTFHLKLFVEISLWISFFFDTV